MALSISDIITIAKISQYLAQDDADKGSLFGARISPQTAKILYMERSSVEWLYNLDPNDTSLRQIANYLYSLCRGYNIRASKVLADALGRPAGSVSPVSTESVPSPLDFTVSGSSFIADGATSKVIDNFIGYNLLFVRNNIPQSTVDLGGGASYFTWNRDTGLFTCSPAAFSGELFQFYPI